MPRFFQVSSCCLLLVSLFLSTPLAAQQVYSTFMSRYDGGDAEYGYAVCETPEGNFAVAGYLSTGAAGADACVTLLDPVGTQLWAFAYGGSNGEEARAIAVTRDSGYILVGNTSSFGAGGADVLVWKTDVFGQVEWARAIGGTADEYGTSVDTTTDGGFIVGGYTRSFGAGNNDGYFIKLSASGAVQWTRVVGGYSAELIYDVVQMPSGGYSGGGFTSTFGSPSTEYYLVQLDASGNLVNTVTYGSNSSENGFGLISTSDGGLMLYGYGSGFGTGGNEGLLVKTDQNGLVSWAHAYGSPAMDRIFHVVETRSGDFIATGETTTNTFGAGDQQVFKVDALGNLIWARHYGTPVDETGFGGSAATSDGGLILAAWDDNDEDFLITKMDSMGDSGCNNALSALTTTVRSLSISTGGSSSSGGTVTNVALPVSSFPLTAARYCSTLLPVGEVEISATGQGRENLIRWELSAPAQVAGLSLERSTDGRFFSERHPVREIAAQGSYLDPTGQEPVWYYRLALTDADGAVFHSEVRRVVTQDLAREVAWSFGGAAVSSRLVSGLAPDEALDWQFLDLSGKVLKAGSVAAEEQVELDLPAAPGGLYLLRVSQAGRPFAWKVQR